MHFEAGSVCPICQGRGEVEAGITYGRSYGWVDEHGVQEREAAEIRINPLAWCKRACTIWFLDYIREFPLWSLAICIMCHGTGMREANQEED